MCKSGSTPACSDPEFGVRHHLGEGGGGVYGGPARRVFTLGVGGPVGSGKTALVERLCRTFYPEFDLAVITNDIYTREDAEFLSRREALPLDRIVGVETGGCPHSAIREDASVNLAAVTDLERRFPKLEIVIVESGGDNLAATFSPELADRTIYVIDVAEGDKIPRKGGPGICRSDLLVINKIDLAPHGRADLEVMRRDTLRMRGQRPFRMISLRRGDAVEEMLAWVRTEFAQSRYADFVTPPEFAGLELAENPVGRIGGVDLELVDKGHGLRLGRCWQQIPLRVLPPLKLGPDQPGLLYLINPTAGLFDGDGHLVRLVAKKGTRTVFVGQSATRIHPALRAFSTQQWEIVVETGASLVVLPGPTIPFAGCRSFQRVTVDLADGARFAWGDIGLPGRYARGENSERFRFETLIQQFEVRRQDALVYRDRLAWRGPWNDDVRRWHLGEQDAYGSVFMSGDVPGDAGAARFRTGAGDTVMRSLGTGEATIATVVGEALRFAGLRVVPDLATNHWFSVGAT